MKYTGRVFILSASLSVVLRVVCLCVSLACLRRRTSVASRETEEEEGDSEGREDSFRRSFHCRNSRPSWYARQYAACVREKERERLDEERGTGSVAGARVRVRMCLSLSLLISIARVEMVRRLMAETWPACDPRFTGHR